MEICKHDASESPLSVEFDTSGYGGLALVEVWVKDVGEATFNVYGKCGCGKGDWRLVDQLTVPYNGKDNRHEGYFNAYRHIKVSTDSTTASEIEIIAGAM